jgi:anti-sigma factor RsiW
MLHHLENNDAVLLMYLAGELPPDDRLEIEQQLKTDAGLRASLEELKSLTGGITETFAAADGFALPQSTESARSAAMTRRVSRAMTKQRLEQSARPAETDTAGPQKNWLLRLPRWAYPITAAAVLLIAAVSYWGFTNGNDSSVDQLADRRNRLLDEASSLPTPPSTTSSSEASGVPSEQMQLTAEALPSINSYPRGVDDSDRNVIAVSAGAYDVSTLFSTDPDAAQ